MLSYRATFDTLRSMTAASLDTNYAIVGAASLYPIVAVKFTNLTNGDVVISLDGTNDMIYVASNSFTLYDLRTNAAFNTDFMLPVGTPFLAKDGATIATTGTFYIETLIAKQILGGS